MHSNKQPIVFLDVETTGLDISESRIIQFGAIKVYPDDNKIERLSYFINPGIPVPEEAFNVHHISTDFLKDKPSFPEVALSIRNFISDCHLAGFNLCSYDLPILDRELYRCDLSFPPYVTIIDVLKLVYRFQPRNLETSVKLYCPDYKFPTHDAVADSEATYELLKAMLVAHADDLKNFSDLTVKSADIAGYIGYDSNNDYVFTFGKFKDEKISEHVDYCNWIISNNNFPLNTKTFLKNFLSDL